MITDRLNILLHCISSCAKSIQAHSEDVTDAQAAELQELYEALHTLQEAVVFGTKPEPAPSVHVWTRPFHGISHCGALSTENVWVTVQDFKEFAQLRIHRPNSGFETENKIYTTVAAAKAAGEKILDKL